MVGGALRGHRPLGFRCQSVEREKYERTLDLCGPGPFGSAIEVGCGEGVFTELLAPRCASLLAVEASATAVARARYRLRACPQVVVERRMLPLEMPSGPFNLIVASDLLYYWTEEDLRANLPVIEKMLVFGGRLVCVHYALPMGALLTGDEVQEILGTLRLTSTHSETLGFSHGRWRLDAFEQQRTATAIPVGPSAKPETPPDRGANECASDSTGAASQGTVEPSLDLSRRRRLG